MIGGDPVEQGLVASLNRPGGNVTGVSFLNAELAPSGWSCCTSWYPGDHLALLVNPTNPALPRPRREICRRRRAPWGCSSMSSMPAPKATSTPSSQPWSQRRAGALVIGADPFFTSRREQFAALRSATPAGDLPVSRVRRGRRPDELRSSLTDAYRLAGVYAGRILKGEKPADLPVQQATKFELVINLKTAKALGLTVPLPLLGRADEVIE